MLAGEFIPPPPWSDAAWGFIVALADDGYEYSAAFLSNQPHLVAPDISVPELLKTMNTELTLLGEVDMQRHAVALALLRDAAGWYERGQLGAYMDRAALSGLGSGALFLAILAYVISR